MKRFLATMLLGVVGFMMSADQAQAQYQVIRPNVRLYPHPVYTPSQWNRFIQQIYRNPNLTPAQKRRQHEFWRQQENWRNRANDAWINRAFGPLGGSSSSGRW
jgi:hypothetical protein